MQRIFQIFSNASSAPKRCTLLLAQAASDEFFAEFGIDGFVEHTIAKTAEKQRRKAQVAKRKDKQSKQLKWGGNKQGNQIGSEKHNQRAEVLKKFCKGQNYGVFERCKQFDVVHNRLHATIEDYHVNQKE